jgi:cytosolic carboxypeptidase protein 2/3
MKPVVFSLSQHRKMGNGWARKGDNVVYGLSPVHDVLEGIQSKLYCLTFDLRFNEDDDFLTVSAGPPYSYSRLIRQLRDFKEIGQRNGLEWSQRTIAYTLSNNQVPYLVIRKT